MLVIRPRSGSGLRRGAIRPAGSSVPVDVNLTSLADRAPDAALISALALNDEAAAVAFVRRFQGPVFGLAVSITRDRVPVEVSVCAAITVRAASITRSSTVPVGVLPRAERASTKPHTPWSR